MFLFFSTMVLVDVDIWVSLLQFWLFRFNSKWPFVVNRWFYWPFLLDIYIHSYRCWYICTRANWTMIVFSLLSILLYIEHTLGVLFSRWSGLFLIWNVLIYFEFKPSNKNLRCLLLKIWPLEICWSTVFLLFTKYIRRLLRLDLVFQLLYCLPSVSSRF